MFDTKPNVFEQLTDEEKSMIVYALRITRLSLKSDDSREQKVRLDLSILLRKIEP